jgi:hypothetical protein
MNRTGVASTHTVKIFQGSSTNPINTTGWSLKALPQTVPASLWSAPPVPFTQTPAQPSYDVLKDELGGFTVTAPLPEVGASRGAVELQALMDEYLTPAGQAPLSGGVKPCPDYVPSFSQDTVGAIGQVMSTAAEQNRGALFAALSGTFDGVNGDLSELARSSEHLFSDAPMAQA